MSRLSIKWRVTLWYTGFFAALSALVLSFIYTNSTRMTATSIQQNLIHAVMEATDEIDYDDGTLEIDDGVEDFDGILILIYDRNSELYYGRRPSGFAAPIDPGELQTVDAEDHQWYVYDLAVEVDGYGDVLVRGIASSAAAQIAGNSILYLALVAFPFLILIAGLGGYLITKRAFLPIKRITDTASSISSGGDLSKRFSIKGTRDEIYALAETFNSMFDRLEYAFLNEKRFTSDASHELRTPTSVIISQCEYALSSSVSPEEQETALRTILHQAQQMSALIAQLLTLARMDAGSRQIELEEVELDLLLEMVTAELEEEATLQEVAFHLELQPGLVLHADQTLLTRMLINLIGNAVKYGSHPGDIWISARKEENTLICAIRDNGLGVPPEQLDKIWERFYRGDPSRRQGSFGLGLPMAKWIAQAHGGSIEVQSTVGEGSIFTVRLPSPQNDTS